MQNQYQVQTTIKEIDENNIVLKKAKDAKHQKAGFI